MDNYVHCLVFLKCDCFSSPGSQEAPLHEELHPHASLCVVHLEGHRRVRQRRRPLRGRGGGQLLIGHCELI